MCKKKHTYADLVIVENYIMGKIDIVETLVPYFDMNKDGKLSASDLTLLKRSGLSG